MKRLMEINSYSDGASFWRVACNCTDPNHDAQLWFDLEDGLLSLNLSIEVGFYPRYTYTNAIERAWTDFKRRVAAAASILFRGHFTAAGDVILDQDGIAAMQTALARGLEHAQNAKSKKNVQ